MTASRHWANINESGSILGMQILVTAYRIGGPHLFRITLFPVVCFYFLFRPQARRSIHQFHTHVHRMQGTQANSYLRECFANFWQFGLALIDKFGVWMGKVSRQDVVIHNGDLIKQLLQDRKGAILLLSHLGNFEICQALSQSRPELKLNVLHHTKNAEKFNRLLSKYNSRNDINLLQVTEINAATAIQMSERIEQGEFIAMAGDRIAVDNPEAAFTLDFIGNPAPFPKGIFALALALSAPVIFVICIKQYGRYHIYFDQLSTGTKTKRSDRRDAMLQLARQYADRLEYYCLKTPEQWFNFFDFWAVPDKESD